MPLAVLRRGLLPDGAPALSETPAEELNKGSMGGDLTPTDQLAFTGICLIVRSPINDEKPQNS